jgi:reverse gyrase
MNSYRDSATMRQQEFRLNKLIFLRFMGSGGKRAKIGVRVYLQ